MNNPQVQIPSPTPLRIEENLYLLRPTNPSEPMVSTPAVLVDGEEMILIGVGQKGEFPSIVAQLQSIMPLDRLHYVIAPGMERHLVSTMIALREVGANPVFVIEEKLDRLMNLSARGVPLKRIGREDGILVLRSGKILRFIPTPFIITSMAFATIDETAGILFSHYLFDLAEPHVADPDLTRRIRQTMDFCVNYVPSSDFIRPVLQKIATLHLRLAITQSGIVLNKEELTAYETALSTFDFFNNPKGFIHIENGEKSIDYSAICHQVLRKLKSVYGNQALLDTLRSGNYSVDPETWEVTSSLPGPVLLDEMLEEIRRSRGLAWILTVEPLISRIADLYDFEKPKVFRTVLEESERKLASIGIEKSVLETKVEALEKHLKDTMEKLTKDSFTGHYNELFLHQYLEEQIKMIDLEQPLSKDLQLYYIQVDNILAINTKYSVKIGDETIRNLGYLLEQVIRPQDLLVKRNGPGYIVFVIDPAERIPSQFARTLQNAAKNSEAFIEPITLSIAVVQLSEFLSTTDRTALRDRMRLTGEGRIKSVARKTGVFVDENTAIEKGKYGRLLIADGEEINLRLLESLFYNENFEVKTAKDGLTALQFAKESTFDAIIVERTISKLDGMLLKQNINQTAQNGNALFILLTFNKTPEIISRANQLGIDLVVQKPVIFEELTGMIRRAMKKGEH